MRKHKALFEVVTALLLLALGAPSWAATVRITEVSLDPQTITVNRGEEIVWLDDTISRTAQLNLHNGKRAGTRSSLAEPGVAKATFEEPGTYEYRAYTGAGGLQPRALNGWIIVK
ncbi:MAG: hypothetical protein L0177_00695 [Chloroflexi bacterium]|nr:hypothetical protein [Chloroflexota bacterium]